MLQSVILFLNGGVFHTAFVFSRRLTYVAAVFFMTVVYPLQAQRDYTELLFSLRSIDKFLTSEHDVIIVGDVLPEWITNITQISVPDILNRKQLTIKKKIHAAFQCTDKMFFMNDDIFLLFPTDGYSYPFYYQSTLKAVGESGARPLQDVLLSMNRAIKNFDIHFPIVYEKEFFQHTFKHFSSDVIIKSCYCNYLGIEGTPATDLKVNRKISFEDLSKAIIGRTCFSTGASGIGFALPVLQQLFPDKSKYEI